MSANPSMLIRIAANLSELRTNLKEGKDQVETTTQAMQKLANSFQGEKLIQQAHNIVAAVKEVGGASRLTEAEQARVNATLERAIDKYAVMGREAPKAMRDLFDATKRTVEPINELDQLTAKLTAELGAVNNQALAYVAAVTNIGGASKLTADEQAKVNAVLTSALEKYQSLGQEAPASMVKLQQETARTEEALQHLDQFGVQPIDRIGGAAVGAAPKVSGLRGAVSQFDNVLQAMGINVMPVTKGIDDIASAAGKTTSQVGALGTAGLALAAGYAGWKVGRMIADFFELDKAVEKGRLAVFLFGDTTASTVGAKMDVINRAIANGAKEWINYAQAVQFNIKHQQDLDDRYVMSGQKLADAWRQVLKMSDARREEILRAKENGATEEMLQRQYGASADVLKILTDRKKLSADMSKARAEAVRKEKEADEAYNVEIARQIVLFDNLNKAAAAAMASKAKEKAAQDWINAMERSVIATNHQRVADAALQAQQGNGLTIIGRTAAEYTKAGSAAESAGKQSVNAFAGVAQQVQITGDGLREYINLMRYTAQANAILSENSLFTTTSQRQRLANLPAPREAGGPVSAGVPYLVGERGPEVIVPERSGTVIPNGGRVGGSTVVHITAQVHVAGNLLGNRFEVSDAIRHAMRDALRDVGIPMPAGV